MRHVASCSFGKDSLAMVLTLIERGYPLDEVVFYDTGMEFQAIYNLRDQVKPLLESKGVLFTELKPPKPFLYMMLDHQVNKRDGSTQKGYGWCGGTCRWGTSYKARTINAYAQDAVGYIGIASDETERIEKERPANQRLPLVDWGMTEKDCLQLCRDKGFSWDEHGIDLYSILDRVSCWCCRNSNLKELENIKDHLPDYWERLVDLENQIGEPMKTRCGKPTPLDKLFTQTRMMLEAI